MKNNFFEILLGWFILFLILLFFSTPETNYNKQNVADYFKVSRKTLGKWVELLPDSTLPSNWSTIRKISSFNFIAFKTLWGCEGYRTMNKKQLIEKCESNYETLAENVKMNLDKIGISEEAWSKLSAFPPVICKRIITVMG